jgi:RNA-dependent RNA polymerase
VAAPRHTHAQISNSLAYRFIFMMSKREEQKLRDMLARLRVLSRTDPALAPAVTGTTLGADIVTVVKTEFQRRYAKARPRLVGDVQPPPAAALEEDLPFSTRWLIDGLISQNIVLPAERWDLLRALDEFVPVKPLDDEIELVIPGESKEDRERREAEQTGLGLRERVLEALFNEERIHNIRALLSSECRVDDIVPACESYVQLRITPRRTPERARQVRRPRRQPGDHVLRVYRVQITPTRVLLFPPEDETSNSVLRTFGHVDRFLRVSFSDEEDNLFVSWFGLGLRGRDC